MHRQWAGNSSKIHSVQNQKRLYFILSFLPFPALLPSVSYQFPPEQCLNNKSLAHESSSQGLFLDQSSKDRLLQGWGGMVGKWPHSPLGATEQNQHKISLLNETLPGGHRKSPNMCERLHSKSLKSGDSWELRLRGGEQGFSPFV